MSSNQSRNRKLKKKQQKNSKNQKIPSQHLYKPKLVRKHQKREKRKKFVPMSSYPTHARKFQKNSKKILKIRKLHHSIVQAKRVWGRLRKREKKKIRSDEFLPNPCQKIPKKQPKNLKNLKTTPRHLFKPKQFGEGRE